METGNDPRYSLVQAIMSSNNYDEFYKKISDLIVDEEGIINFYFFDIGVAIVDAFHKKSRITEEELIENTSIMQRRESSIN